MTKWTLPDLPDQSDRTVIVTGASSGLGLIVAREFAAAGARVVLAVRDVAKGREVAAQMTGWTEVRELDVADLSSVRRFAAAWHGPIDVLVNNAGIMEVPLVRTADGFESQFATNYLGPFVLTGLLLPHITDRVVTVSSQLHRMGKVHLHDLNWTDRPYMASGAYNDSKLAEVLFSLELQRRLEAAGRPVRSIVAHPGIASTNLARHAASGKVTHALRFLFNDPHRRAVHPVRRHPRRARQLLHRPPRPGQRERPSRPRQGCLRRPRHRHRPAPLGRDRKPSDRYHQPGSDSMNVNDNTIFIAAATTGTAWASCCDFKRPATG